MIRFIRRWIFEAGLAFVLCITLYGIVTTPWTVDNAKHDVVRAKEECKDFGGVLIVTSRTPSVGPDAGIRTVRVSCHDHLGLTWKYKE